MLVRTKLSAIPEWETQQGGGGQVSMVFERKIWDADLGEIKTNKASTKKHAGRYRIGSVRLAEGLICTRAEFEEEKKRILSIPLP